MLNAKRLAMDGLALRRIAEGGCADIHVPDTRKSNQPRLIVKVLKTHLCGYRSVAMRFEYERDILEQLSHPRLPNLIGHGHLSGRPYLAYHYIAGVPGLKLLGAGVHSTQACRIMRSLLQLLTHLEGIDGGIVHGDLSPDNVIVSDYDEAHLIDFGCAQRLQGGVVADTRWIAKPSYMSPEQAQGNAWDRRSDLYQAGIFFYELLAGKRWNPHRGRSAMLYAAQPAMPNLAGVPLPLRALLLRLLAPAPERRWNSAREALDELGDAAPLSVN